MSGHGVDRSGASSGTGAPVGVIQEALIDAKGDLIAGTAADTPGKLTVGANDTILMAASGQITGLKWATPAVVNAALGPLGADGTIPVANASATTGIQYLSPGIGFSLINGYLDWTVNANALTVAIKGLDGNDPSTTNPVFAWVRSATTTSGVPSLIKIIAANSVVVSSGSTLGTRDSVPFRLWAVLFDDAGTYRLGIINCTTTIANAGSGSDVTAIYPLAGWGIASSTAEGGAGAADSAQVIYTGTAVTAKGYAVLGYATWESGLATVGTWGTAASRKQLFGPGVPLPTQRIQLQRTQPGAAISGATAFPRDDTSPQNTEGTQAYSQPIVTSSAANVLKIDSVIFATQNTGAGNYVQAALFVDAVANAIAAADEYTGTDGTPQQIVVQAVMLAAAIAAVKVRFGNPSGANSYVNAQSGGGRVYGGVASSFLEVEELMA